MKDPTIHHLFPTPVYFSHLERNFTALELKFVKKNKKDSYQNQGNITSNNNCVLNEKPFLDIKKQLDLKIKEYFDKIVCSSNKITPYITQSWLNYTDKNQYHHKHSHANSLISGVLYINSDKKFDKIMFFKGGCQKIHLAVKEYNSFNSNSWWFSVETGDIVLFPSSLTHMVETKKGDNTRVSLSFNVFIKGTLGSNKNLTELTL
jgi:uncharacterized protein (TIGR02466 family)|tara:strand:- start:73 stop:687 length:615 start_codon:yes stop_codon:yes gene_type:complete